MESQEYKSKEDMLAHYEERGKPSLDVESKGEIYLLDDENNRVRRICGKNLKDMPEGYVCLNTAGYRTNHPGRGPCHVHSHGTEGYYWLEQITRAAKKNNLSRILDEVRDHKVKMEDVEDEVILIQSLITAALEKASDTDEEYMDFDAIDKVVGFVREMIKAKEASVRIQNASKLDRKEILTFIDQMFTFIAKFFSKYVSDEVIAEFFQLAGEELIDPITNSALRDGKVPREKEDGDIVLEKDNEIENDRKRYDDERF